MYLDPIIGNERVRNKPLPILQLQQIELIILHENSKETNSIKIFRSPERSFVRRSFKLYTLELCVPLTNGIDNEVCRLTSSKIYFNRVHLLPPSVSLKEDIGKRKRGRKS